MIQGISKNSSKQKPTFTYACILLCKKSSFLANLILPNLLPEALTWREREGEEGKEGEGEREGRKEGGGGGRGGEGERGNNDTPVRFLQSGGRVRS